MKKILFTAFLLFCFSGISFAYAAKKNIKVGVITNADSFTVAATDDYFISDADGKKFKLTKGMTAIAAFEGGFKMGKYTLIPPLRVESSNGIIFADKKAYRGFLTVSKFNARAVVINVLTIEDYLKGVLPKEASPGWGMEALKAQAVISRTYTLANMGKHGGLGFDMCDTTHCQVYSGAAWEALSCNIAISKTKAEILTYGGKLAQTVFHANCGGHTEDPKYVWNWGGVTPEYLKGVKCGYCETAPHAVWEKTLDESFIIEKLSKFGVGKIKSIDIKGKTPAGSAQEIVIDHSKGTLDMNAYKFRIAVDAWQIKSTTFDSIKKDGAKFTFKGKGWGHKVGLCQWGAKGMADKGKKYKNILEHYYPKTKMEKAKYE
ncbi:MAG: SpoIID/LytB domain-containing protein [Endomicrobia bacterium]|nr:SpoIID/LytB domain-containing protein [Endomicrobiia bacterium]